MIIHPGILPMNLAGNDALGDEPHANQANAIDTENLRKLHTRVVDALAGFEVMVDKAEPEFKPIATAFRDLHTQHAGSLTRHLAALGVAPDSDGSFFSMVNEAVVNLRALFDDIDADVMTNIRNGEDNVLAAFDDAIADDLPAHIREPVVTMRNELVHLLEQATAQAAQQKPQT